MTISCFYESHGVKLAVRSQQIAIVVEFSITLHEGQNL